MSSHDDKLKNLKESTDAVFSELFGSKARAAKKAMKQRAQELSGQGQVTKKGNDYVIGNSVVTKLNGVSEEVFMDYDFKNSPLRWLLDAKFKGELTIKLTGQVEVTSFNGVWFDGIFKGKFFGGVSKFAGGQFGDTDAKPAFLPKHDQWKASPYFFFDGIIEETGGGILGVDNLAPGEIDYSFNLLAIKPGQTITINLNDGTSHSVTCIKRLGGNNRMFSYDVVDGRTGNKQRVTYDWSDIRGADKVSFHKNTTINFQSPSLKEIKVFKLDVSSGIKSASVALAGTTGPVSEPEGENVDYAATQQVYDLAKIPGLNVKQQQRGPGGKMLPLPPEAKGKAYFYIPDASYMKKYNEVVSNIKSGIFQKDISIVRSAIKNGLINGYGTNPYLKPIFGEQGDNKEAPKEVKESLSRINDFVRFFVDRMHVQGDNNQEDEARQKLVMDKLRSALGVQKQPESPEQQPSGGKTKEKMGKIKLKNEIRGLVGKIIADNM